MSVLEQLAARKLVPVVVLDDPSEAEPLAHALVAGGLPVAEVTFRTAAAEDAIKIMSARGDVLVGAGTVLTVEQVDRAVDAGAEYIVSPGTSIRVIERCRERGVPVLPGAVSATGIQNLLEMGIDTIKFFPAGTSGGAAAIKALSAPFGAVSFIPTGGIGLSNLDDYLTIPSVVAVGGSWMVPPTAIREGRFAEIAELCEASIAAVQSISSSLR
ncbi:bifunctional 4-hydroxy-2-oxoglutarate aldolase/2-dehydro-3-deoxy-phosphogluconate aldolase [Actinomycetaceae bacterium L2_0104]